MPLTKPPQSPNNPTKLMELPEFDPRKENPRTTPMTFQALLDQLRPQLEKVPEPDKIPLLPPSPSVLEEVQDYVRSALLLPVAESLPTSIQVGSEFLDRSLIRVGRVGIFKELPVFAFIYPFVSKRLDCALVYPKDEVDIEMIGKIVFWGQTPSIPLKYVRTEILSAKTFCEIETFSLIELADAPALKALEDRAWRSATTKILEAEGLQKAAESRARTLEIELQEESRNREYAETARDDKSSKLSFWRTIAATTICILALFLAGIFFFWPRSIG